MMMAPGLKNFKWLQTEDGSYTLHSLEFDETCHSLSGARTETNIYYLDACQITKLSQVSILEVGFGLGLGFEVTREALCFRTEEWSYLGLEIDQELLNLYQQTHPTLEWKKINAVNYLQGKIDHCHLTILCGDARKTLSTYMQHFPQQFNAIYQDPFSPKKNPMLWTQEWFSLLKVYAHPDVNLSTYSASNSVRKALVASGWKVQNGAGFGKKKTSTTASLKGENDPLILQLLERSPVPILSDDKIQEFLETNRKV